MDFEHDRDPRSLDIVGRQRDPGRDRHPVGRSDRQFARFAEHFRAELGIVERSQLTRAAARRHSDIGRAHAARGGEGDRAPLAHRPLPAGIWQRVIGAADARRARRHVAVQRDARDAVLGIVFVAREQPGFGPFDPVYPPVERCGELARTAAVGVHHVEIGLVERVADIVEAEIGDPAAVGRDLRRKVGAGAVGQRGDRAGREIERVDFRAERFELPVLAAVGAEQQGPAIGRPFDRPAARILAEGQLARRAAGRIDHEQLHRPRLDVAPAVIAIGDLVDHLQRLAPFGAFGLGRRLAEYQRLARHARGVGEALTIGRPADRAGCLGQRGDVRADPARHPAHVQFGPAAAFGGDIGQPVAPRRPARRGVRAFAGHQRRFLAARNIDQPDRADRPVEHDVVGLPDIGDPFAVGADLRIGADRQAEQVGPGEVPLGRVARVPGVGGLVILRRERTGDEECGAGK